MPSFFNLFKHAALSLFIISFFHHGKLFRCFFSGLKFYKQSSIIKPLYIKYSMLPNSYCHWILPPHLTHAFIRSKDCKCGKTGNTCYIHKTSLKGYNLIPWHLTTHHIAFQFLVIWELSLQQHTPYLSISQTRLYTFETWLLQSFTPIGDWARFEGFTAISHWRPPVIIIQPA